MRKDLLMVAGSLAVSSFEEDPEQEPAGLSHTDPQPRRRRASVFIAAAVVGAGLAVMVAALSGKWSGANHGSPPHSPSAAPSVLGDACAVVYVLAPGPTETVAKQAVELQQKQTAAGTPAQIWGFHGKRHQMWRQCQTGDGSFNLQPVSKPEMCLSVARSVKSAPVVILPCDGSLQQRWREHSSGFDAHGRAHRSLVNAADGRALSLPPGKWVRATNLQAEQASGSAWEQLFWVMPVPPASLVSRN